MKPVIGLVSQTLESKMQTDPRFEGYTSYIMTSYVNFVAGAGSRVVPLVKTDSDAITLSKLEKLNGVLFPGGDGEYFDFGKKVFDQVLKWNQMGQYYPLWGTCLGYESIS